MREHGINLYSSQISSLEVKFEFNFKITCESSENKNDYTVN